MEFDDLGLVKVRKARQGEFPGIDSARRMTDREKIREHLLDMGARSATQIADELGMRRDSAARILARDPVFVKAGTLGHQQLYGVVDVRAVHPQSQLATVAPAAEHTQLEAEELPF